MAAIFSAAPALEWRHRRRAIVAEFHSQPMIHTTENILWRGRIAQRHTWIARLL